MSVPRIDQDARPGLKRFRMAQKPMKVARGSGRRDPPGILIWPSGIGVVNVAGSEIFDESARAEGIEKKEYSIVFGGDEDAGQAAAVTVEPNTLGATPVRRDPMRKTLTVYMGGMFDDCPALRPTSRRWCKMNAQPDGGTGSFILIHLNQGLERRKNKRNPADPPNPAPPGGSAPGAPAQ